jgi:uncharacterized membrane protein (DUF4010 family)
MGLIENLPPESIKIVLVLFLSFLLGLEREENKAPDQYSFGGVRTFPLIGMAGYAVGLISDGQVYAEALGLLAISGFLWLSYQHKISTAQFAGLASEISGVLTYLLGALVYHGQYWIATTLAVASLLMLETKTLLEGLAQRIPREDVLAFGKFLLLSAVILPVVPNQEFTPYQINPYKTWLVVVAVSAVSYGSYVLQQFVRDRGGVTLAALLGGAYSSTVTTIALARRSRGDDQPRLYAGAALMACGVMYLRLAVLLAIFNRALMQRLLAAFVVLAAICLVAGWLWSRSGTQGMQRKSHAQPKNPLDLGAAFLFALIFLATLVVTHLLLERFGNGSVYVLSAIMGLSDVDPYIMSLTQSAPSSTPLELAAQGILIAAASNNALKGVYAGFLGAHAAGRQMLALLLALAVLGLLPLALI